MNKIRITLCMTVIVAGIMSVGCDKTGSGTGGGTAGVDSLQTVTADGEPKINYNGQIAYVQLDSLMRGYGKAIDLQDAFSKKNEKIEKELTSQGRALQREATEFQEKYNKGQLTAYQANEIGTGLQKKEQDFNAYAKQKTDLLMEEQEVIMNQISEAIMAYVKKYNVQKGYSMIISTTGANTVLTGDPALNVTGELLEGLNAEYKEELAKKVKEEEKK